MLPTQLHWLSVAAERVLPPAHPDVLRARFWALKKPVDCFDPRRVELLDALARDLEACEETSLLADVLLLFAKDVEGADAIAAAKRAEKLFRSAGDEQGVRAAVCLHGERPFGIGQLDGARALLRTRNGDPILDQPVGYELVPESDAQRSALSAAASAAASTPARTSPEWVRALGGLAEAFSDPSLAAQAREQLEELAAIDDLDDAVYGLVYVARGLLDDHPRAAGGAADLLDERFPDDLDAAAAAAEAFAKLGDARRASRAFERAARAAPDADAAFDLWLKASHAAVQGDTLPEAERFVTNAAGLMTGAEQELRLAVARIEVQHGVGTQAMADAVFALFEEARHKNGDELAETEDGHRLVEVVIDALLPAMIRERSSWQRWCMQ